ncbi:DGQHR domain-containing protein DpdB [Chloroflexota bacterium]
MRFEALRIIQPSGRPVFAFATTAEEILNIAKIQRISRDFNDTLVGFQRPEVMSHISEIRRYIDGDDGVLPNTIVIAFDDNVKFIPSDLLAGNGHGNFGTLEIPTKNGNVVRPGFIIDGQQKLAAIATSVHSNFPIFVTAMIAPDIKEQRKQFVLVNRTKPLPKGMIYELLPEIDGILPPYLIKQQFAALITTQLNLQPHSFLYKKIKTPTCPQGYIKDNSIRRLITNSLTDGVLYTLSEKRITKEELIKRCISIVSTFWEGVYDTFGFAFTLPPKESRLTHGVGIASMGYVMDYIFPVPIGNKVCSPKRIANMLKPLKSSCAWTDGYWDFSERGIRPWNDLQNIDRDIRLLTEHLLRLIKNGHK